MKGYLTVNKVAEFLGVTTQTLRNWDKTKKLKAYRHPFNNYRLYREDELIRLLKRISKNI